MQSYLSAGRVPRRLQQAYLRVSLSKRLLLEPKTASGLVQKVRAYVSRNYNLYSECIPPSLFLTGGKGGRAGGGVEESADGEEEGADGEFLVRPATRLLRQPSSIIGAMRDYQLEGWSCGVLAFYAPLQSPTCHLPSRPQLDDLFAREWAQRHSCG